MTDKKVSILYVDDHDARRYTTSRILREAGFEVVEADRGAAAIRLVRKKPDLVILDVSLPDIHGFEVCQRIKTDPATSMIPVLLVSGIYQNDLYKVLGLDRGADGYLTQPVDPPVLIAYVKALLRMREAEAEAVAAGQQWRATFNAIRDSVCLLDEMARVLRCNLAMARLLGRPLDDITGRRCHELVHNTPAPIENCPFERMRESHRRETMVLSLGERRFDITVDPLLDEGDNVIGAVHIMTDITERKRAEEALREHVKRVERLNELFLGREDRVLELKREVNSLLERLGQPPRYESPAQVDELREEIEEGGLGS